MGRAVRERAILSDGSGAPSSEVCAFATWIGPHLSVLTAVATREVGRNDADDVVQDAVVRAWQRRATYDPQRGSPRVWLMTLLLDQARRRRVRGRRHAPVIDTADVPGIGDSSDQHVLRLDIERAVRMLPRRQREVITL
jgi:RNA polymerase sigma-70 factor, ECF subfamily